MSGAYFADGGAFMQGAGSLRSAGRFCGYALFVECGAFLWVVGVSYGLFWISTVDRWRKTP